MHTSEYTSKIATGYQKCTQQKAIEKLNETTRRPLHAIWMGLGFCQHHEFAMSREFCIAEMQFSCNANSKTRKLDSQTDWEEMKMREKRRGEKKLQPYNHIHNRIAYIHLNHLNLIDYHYVWCLNSKFSWCRCWWASFEIMPLLRYHDKPAAASFSIGLAM